MHTGKLARRKVLVCCASRPPKGHYFVTASLVGTGWPVQCVLIQESVMQASRDIARLIEIMAALRTPGTGCPWDLEQDFASIAPYTLEEAYEVADAIARGDLTDLREELGDLLLQVVFHARMAQEQGVFDFGDVVQAITEKLLRRHPHVFGEARGLSPDDVKVLWDRIKSEEKAGKNAGQQAEEPAGALAGV